MKYSIFAAAAAVALTAGASARASTWPPAGEAQIPLWERPPHSMTVDGAERVETESKLVGGRPWTAVSRVVRPTLTVYRPKGRNTGAAVLVYPGGGYWVLAIDLEGTEICDWLTSEGVTCILVKYRVRGDDREIASRTGPYPRSSIALEDAQRAIALTRFHASEWGINPRKIGVIGFSAGGHLVASTSTHDRIYPPTDAIDRQNVRPDFGMALYPGHLWMDERTLTLIDTVPVSARTPPQFIVQSEDDPVDSVNNALVYYVALRKAGVSAEMHLFPNGGHAFGLRHTDAAITGWPRLAIRWLASIGMIDR